METHVLKVMQLVHDRAIGADPANDARDQYRTLIGVHELASAILEVKDSPSFSSLIPHLRLLSDGHSLQNMPSGGADQVTNKLFELLAATWLMQCGSDIDLDDPTSSNGNNPDVLGSLCGKRWGIACKVIHSLNPESFVTHLRKGVDQIEKSPAEIGVVLFNLKNVLPHDQIWPLGQVDDDSGELATGCWSDAAAPFGIMTDALKSLQSELVSYLPEDYLETVFTGTKSVPGFLLWAHSASAVRIDGRPTPTTVRALNFAHLAPVGSDLKRVLGRLTWGAYVGSPERGPMPAC
jgi:hypothetical protein